MLYIITFHFSNSDSFASFQFVCLLFPFLAQLLRARCLGGSLVGLQVVVPDVAFKPFTPQGQGGLGSLSIVSHQTEDGVYGECVSQPFLPGLMWGFSCSPGGWEWLREVLGVSQRKLFRCSCGCRAWRGEVSSGSSHVAVETGLLYFTCLKLFSLACLPEHSSTSL